VQFGSISKFGLLEMSRQRLKPALSEGASIPCPRCGGAGHIRDTESSALQILRIIQEESMKDNSAAVHAQVPVEVASFLLNEKRSEIAKIELQQRINVLLVPNKSLETPHYKLERLKHDDPRLDRIEASYKMAEEIEDATTVTRRSQEPTNKQTPVIKGVLPDAPAPVAPVKAEAPAPKAAAKMPAPAPAPVPAAAASGGFFAWLKNLFGGTSSEPAPASADKKDGKARDARREGGREGTRDSNRGDGRRGGRDGRRGERSEAANGEVRAPREGGRRGEGRIEGREGEAKPARGERTERSERTERGERPAREGRREGRSDTRGENRGEARTDARAETRADAAPELSADGTEVRQERAPREGRRERGERGGEGRRERGERSERRPADAPAPELNGSDAPANAADALEGSPLAEGANSTDNTGERRERRSRDRYGRDRRERNGETRQDNGPEDDPQSGQADAGAMSTDTSAPAQAQERPAGRSYFERAQASAAPAPVTTALDPAAQVTPEAAPMATAAAPSAAVAAETPANTPAPTPVLAAVSDTVSTPVTATPVATAKTEAPAATEATTPATPAKGLPTVSRFDLPIDSLAQMAQSSGLVWVNSDTAKVAAVQAAIAAEPKPVRVPRERPPAVVLDEGPLVLVETRKDLNTLKVPF
jgi:ribonuclease E